MKSILVVEDDAAIRSMVQMVLESEGYDVIVAENGRVAMQRLEGRKPDLIILDMKMPVMDGWQFASEFHRKFDSLSPIVVMTAAADARKRAADIHAEGYVVKPFDIDNLVQIVARSLVERKAA